MCVKTIRLDEYESLRAIKHAGPAESLEKPTRGIFKIENPDWDGKYWAAFDTRNPAWVTCAPVNVEESPTLFD